MNQRRYSFSRGGPERVEVRWNGVWKNVQVAVDGIDVGGVPDSRALKEGGVFTLSDGSSLKLQLVMAELHITRNDRHLPGSSGDPFTRTRHAGLVIIVLGLVSAVLGLIAASGVGVLQRMGFGVESMTLSLVFAGLGWPVLHGSLLALLAALAVYLADTVLSVATWPEGAAPPVAPLMIRAMFFLVMARAVPAALALRRPNLTPDPPAPPRQKRPTQSRASATSPPTSEPHRSLRNSQATAARAGRSSSWGADQASQGLRFVAAKVEIGGTGIVSDYFGQQRVVAWNEIEQVLARRLPPDPPWDGKVLVDIAGPSGDPIRIMPSTQVSFASMPGGAAPSRTENLRRLLKMIRQMCPLATFDSETGEFLEGQGQPAQFPSIRHFVAYDQGFGEQ